MAEDRIDSVIDVAKVNAELESVSSEVKTLVDLIKSTKGASLNVSGAKTVAEYNRLNKELSLLIKQTNAASKAAIDEAKARNINAAAADKEAKAATSSAKAKQIEERLTKNLIKEKENLNKASIKEAERLGKLNNEYEQLKHKYLIASNTAKQMAASQQYSTEEMAEATAAAQRYFIALTNIEKAVGQSQRNVGNYTQATFAFTQVLREAPAFANSFSTGISAISNNLPILIDQLKATGLNGRQMFSLLAKSLLSWQALLPIGFLLVQSYGKEIANWVKGLFSAESAMKRVVAAQETLNDAYKSNVYKDAVKSFHEITTNIDLAKKGFLDKKDVLKQYNETLGKTLGETKNLDEAEKLIVKNGPAYLKMTLLKAAANMALEKAAALAVEIQREAQDPGSRSLAVTLRRTEAEQKYGAEIRKMPEYLRLVKTATDAYNKSIEKGTKENQDAYSAAVSARDDFFESQLELKSVGIKARDKATLFDIAKSFQEEAAKLSKQFNLDFFGGEFDDKNKNKKDKGLSDAQKAQFDAARNEAEELAELQKEIADNENKTLTQRLKAIEMYAFLKQEIILLNNAEELAEAKGNADLIKEINERRAIEERKLARETQKEIDKILFSERIISVEKATKEELKVYDKFYKDLTDRIKGYEKEKDRLDKERKDKDKKNAEERKRLEKQLISELTTLASTLLTANIDREKNAIQEQIDLLEQRKQKDIDVATATITNAQDRAAAITEIEAKANAQREILQQKQRALDNKKAQFERAAAIARIIQETAINVVNYFGTPLALLAAAIGAVQLATVIATPIPKYAHGTDDHPGGHAIVGDGGKSEMVVLPDGTIMKTPSRDTLVDLPSGAQVYPDFEKSMMRMRMVTDKVKPDTATPMIVGELQGLRKDIKKMPQSITRVDNILSQAIRRGNSSVNHLRRSV